MTTAEPVAFDALLTDGGVVHIRALTPDDRDALLALHGRVSPRNNYLRYFTLSTDAGVTYTDRLVRPADADHDGLVAMLGGQAVGIGSYERLAGGDTAEVAFLVDDAHHKLGIGTLLLEHLTALAGARGIRRLVAETLPDNGAMLRVFRDAGYDVRSELEDGTVHVSFPVTPTERLRQASGARESWTEFLSVSRLLRPASVAVVGAGLRPAGLGHRVFADLVGGNFAGLAYPVNLRGAAVLGVPAYRSLADLPSVDLVISAVPAEATLDVARDAATCGARGLVVLSAGFAEAGPEGAARQRELLQICREAGMRLIGPNSTGVLNTVADVTLNATPNVVTPPAGAIGLMSQSGAVGYATLDWATRTGLGVSSFVSVGNKADVSGNDLLMYWEHDPATRVCLLYLESFGNPRKFARVARRVGRSKPIVAVKAGRSVAGLRGALAHTAAGASQDVAVDALFEQTGVIRAGSLGEAFDVVTLLDSAPLPAGRRVAVVATSGGPATLAADALETAGLEVPELCPATQERLRALVPGGVANPVDTTPEVTPAAFAEVLRVVLADESVDAVLAVCTPPEGRDEDLASALAEVVAEAPGKPVLASALGRDIPPIGLRDGAGRMAVPYHAFPETAARALAAVVRYAEWRARPEGTEPLLPGVDRAAARALVDDALLRRPGGGRLAAPDTLRLLGHYGVRIEGAGTREGLEIRIGVVHDPSFGPLVCFGLGGMATDLLGDRAYRVLPLTREDAAEQIRSVRAAPLLAEAAADLERLEDLLLRVGQLADDLPEVRELELHPVVVGPHGVAVLAATADVAPFAEPDPLMRRLP